MCEGLDVFLNEWSLVLTTGRSSFQRKKDWYPTRDPFLPPKSRLELKGMREQFEEGLSTISGAKAFTANIVPIIQDSIQDLAFKMPMAIIKVVNHAEALMDLEYDATFGDSNQVENTKEDIKTLIEFGVQFITLFCVIKAKNSKDEKKSCSLKQK